MNIITYSTRNLTFKAETAEELKRVLRRCEIAKGQLTPEAAESDPTVMTEAEYLAARHLDSLDGVTFDDPNYL